MPWPLEPNTVLLWEKKKEQRKFRDGEQAKVKYFIQTIQKKGLIMFESKTLHPFDDDDDVTEVKTLTDTKSTSSVNSHSVLLSFIVATSQVLREVLLNI